MRFPRFASFAICALILSLPLLAQSPNGNINGQVVDASNSVISGADIVAANDVTGVKYSTKTNDDGLYMCCLSASGTVPAESLENRVHNSDQTRHRTKCARRALDQLHPANRRLPRNHYSRSRCTTGEFGNFSGERSRGPELRGEHAIERTKPAGFDFADSGCHHQLAGPWSSPFIPTGDRLMRQ
jgi:hypothetical protein